MRAYLLQRLLVTVPAIWGVTTMVFLLLHLTPGDPVDAMLGETASPAARAELRVHLGLDRPLLEQYTSFLTGLVRGDLGISIHSGEPVLEAVVRHFPMTFVLAGCALLLGLLAAVPLGLAAAARPGGVIDRAGLFISLIGVSLPNFWLGPMLVLWFALGLGWLPVAGSESPAHLVLPTVTLALSLIGILTRMTRTTVVEVMGEDYIRTARALGASEKRILVHHALRNALTPLITVVALQGGALLAGSVITETIFAWPGIGRLTVDAIRMRDYPVVQGCVLAIALSYIVANLVADVAYNWADPRARNDRGQ